MLADERPALARALRDLGVEVILAGAGQHLDAIAIEEDAAVVIGDCDLTGKLILDTGQGDEDLLRAVRKHMDSMSS